MTAPEPTGPEIDPFPNAVIPINLTPGPKLSDITWGTGQTGEGTST